MELSLHTLWQCAQWVLRITKPLKRAVDLFERPIDAVVPCETHLLAPPIPSMNTFGKRESGDDLFGGG